MPSKIPRPASKEAQPERTDSQSSTDSSRRTSTRLAAKGSSKIPELSRTSSVASTASVESTSSQMVDDFVKPKRTNSRNSNVTDSVEAEKESKSPSRRNTPTRGRRATSKEGDIKSNSGKEQTSKSPPKLSPNVGSDGRPRTRSITRSNSVLSDVSDVLENSVFKTPSKDSTDTTANKNSRRKSRANAVVELDVIDEDDIVICSQPPTKQKTPQPSPSRAKRDVDKTPTRAESPSRITRSMRKKGVKTPTDEDKVIPILTFESDEEKQTGSDNDFVFVDNSHISPVATPTKHRNTLLVKNLTKALFTPLESPKKSKAVESPKKAKDDGTPKKSKPEGSPKKSDDVVKSPKKAEPSPKKLDADKTPKKSEAQQSPKKSATKTKSPKSPKTSTVVDAGNDSEDAMDWEPIPLVDDEDVNSDKSAKVSDDTTVAFNSTEVQTRVVCEQDEKPSSPDSDISVILLSETAQSGETSTERSMQNSQRAQGKGTDAAHRTESDSSSRDASFENSTELDKEITVISDDNESASNDKIDKVLEVKKAITDRKSPKSPQKKKKSDKEQLEKVMDQEETIDEPKRNRKGKKATALLGQTTGEDNLVDPVQDDEKEQSDGIHLDDLTFKSLFKRPAATGKQISTSLSKLYSWTCHLKKRPDDLCDQFINEDEETVWQHIAHKNKQIFKDFNKLKSILSEDIQLHKKQDDDEDDEDDDEEEEMDDEEFDDEEDFDDEEGETDLFNLKGEDLAELERKLQAGLDDDGEPLSDHENDEEEEAVKEKKKYPKSSVDDKFFNLAEMDAFLDEAEKAKDKDEDDGLLLTTEDNWGGAADYKYEDFFGKLEDVVGDSRSKKEKKPKKRSREETDQLSAPKKKKSVHWEDEQGEDENEDLEDEEQFDEAEPEPEPEQDVPVLLGEADKDDEQPQTKLRESLKKLKQTIKTLEDENLKPRSWELSGEVAANERFENELLEKHLEYDYGAKKAPEVTEDFTENLESIILQRIKDNVFDDVQRKKKIEERVEDYRNEPIEDRANFKKTLSEVYEKEYQAVAGQTEKEKPNELHVAIENRMKDLFNLIDALSHYEFTPPEARPEIRVVTNMDAIRVEEVGMVASTDAQLLAPEEVKKREKGDIMADDERTKTDKLRQRRKKKMRQRAMVMIVGDKTKDGETEKKMKKKEKESAGAQTKMKSSTFFNQLQETVQNELKDKTTKQKKIKSVKVVSGGGKFKL